MITSFTDARAQQLIAKYTEISALVSEEALETDWSFSKRTRLMLHETGTGSRGTLSDHQYADWPHDKSIDQVKLPISRRGKKKDYRHFGVSAHDRK